MEPKPIHIHRIEATLSLQFPDLKLDQILENIKIDLSRGTGRIRTIFDNKDTPLFALRPLDGYFIPSFAGAKRILESGYNNYQIVMHDDAVPFVAKGKTAFCKFVVAVDDHVVPHSEVFLMDRQNNLLATGTALHPAYAIRELDTGPAVRVRHSRD